MTAHSRGFTLIELMICVMIVVVIAAVAVPALLSLGKEYVRTGDEVRVKATGVLGRVIEGDSGSYVLKLRIDNGPGVTPRYSEVSFAREELEKLVLAEKTAP